MDSGGIGATSSLSKTLLALDVRTVGARVADNEDAAAEVAVDGVCAHRAVLVGEFRAWSGSCGGLFYARGGLSRLYTIVPVVIIELDWAS